MQIVPVWNASRTLSCFGRIIFCTKPMPVFDDFVKSVRGALNHLYDPEYLRHCSLAERLGIANRYDTPSKLQTILIKAIESLRPRPGAVTVSSHSRHIYDILLYRYIQRAGQDEVAYQLGVSARHLRREQAVALDTLASVLWREYGPEHDVDALSSPAPETTEPTAGPVARSDSDVPADLAWLKSESGESTSSPVLVLGSVVMLAQALAAKYQVNLQVVNPEHLPDVDVCMVALRQALLALLAAILPHTPNRQVTVTAFARDCEVLFEVNCPATGDVHMLANCNYSGFADVRRITALCDGRFDVAVGNNMLRATMAFSCSARRRVMVIEDNADSIELLDRFVAGTRYKITGLRQPERSLDVARELVPDIIIVDVMMPYIDGWEVVGYLRQHPDTAHIPIVVCTILAQEELALSLGASAFLQKPVTRTALLAVLDRLAPAGAIKHR